MGLRMVNGWVGKDSQRHMEEEDAMAQITVSGAAGVKRWSSRRALAEVGGAILVVADHDRSDERQSYGDGDVDSQYPMPLTDIVGR
ncbi:thiolase [Sesbania bispinosa]|nr:thiolase [Sesbania bispinosa]